MSDKDISPIIEHEVDELEEEVFLTTAAVNANDEKEKTQGRMTWKVFKYCTTTDWCLIAVGVITNLASGILLPLFMTTFGDLIDNLSGTTPPEHDFMYYIYLQLGLGGVAFVLCGIGVWCFEHAAERQLRAIRSGYLRAVMRQEMGWFDTYDSGVLASKLNQNCVLIREGIGLKLGQLMMFLGMFIAGYVVGLVQGWKLALVLTAPMPIIVICGAFMMKMVGEAGSASSSGYSGAGSIAEESLSAIRSVIAFGLEDTSSKRFNAELDNAFHEGVKGGLYKGLGLGMTLGVLFCTYSLGFWYGSKLVADDLDRHWNADGSNDCYTVVGLCFTGGTAMSVFFCVIIAAFSLGQAGPSLTAFSQAGGAICEVNDLLSRQTAIDPYDPDGKKPDVRSFEGGIQFTDVEFFYPARPEKCIYKSLNLVIRPGLTTALVGASGCGKSTAIQLIERYYDVISGSVTIDGVDIRSYNLKSLRERMAIVSQEPRLFAKSIAENIRDGKPDATLEEIVDAAEKANAHNFIMEFPNTYDTFVGESGTQLSGGQKQRIAIARAIIRNPTVLILDEATSALDNESEKIVQQTLDKLIAESRRTTIVIAHRLSTIRTADRIVVFDNPSNTGGIIVEEGTHEELMEIEDGIYKSLVASQTLRKVDKEGNEIDDESTDDEDDVPADIAEKFAEEFPLREQSLVKLRSKFSKRLSKERQESKVREERKRFWKREAKKSKKKTTTGPPPVKYTRVMKLLVPYWWQLLLGVIGAIINGLIFPLFAIVFSRFMIAFFLPTSEQIRDEASKDACWFLALAAAVFVGNLLQHSCFEYAGQRIIRELRALLFWNMLYQDMEFFDDPTHTTGALSECLAADVGMLKGWTGDNTGIMVQNASCLIAALGISFAASAKLAGVALAGFCMLAPLSLLEMKFMQHGGPVGSAEDEDDIESAGYLMNETISNIRTVAAYCLEEKMSASYDKIVDRDYKKGVQSAVLVGFLWGLSQFGQYAVQALCMWYGSKLVSEKQISEPDMMQAIFALIMAAMGLGQTMVFATDGTKARAAAARVYYIIDRQPQVDARDTGGSMLADMRGAVDFERVNFRYPQRIEVPVYKHLTFDITPGSTVALVGASGCGKSTVVQLIERFYDVGVSVPIAINEEGSVVSGSVSKISKVLSRSTSKIGGGKVLIDSTNIKNVNVKELRRNIGLVSQEPVLFSTTIMENIRMSKPDASDEEVVEAAKMSNAHNFIMKFPLGYNTNVGKGGGQLSGGQKQRVAIARAILRDPKILILDEATSALDAESERIVQAALDKLLARTKRTTVMIAHRLSTVKNADKIIVLVNSNREGSQVAEWGTHDELLEIKGGVYRGLVRLAGGGHK